MLAVASWSMLAVAAKPSPYPILLPKWTPSYAMRHSTIAMASDPTTFFNASLASQFGIVSFDHNNAYALWYKNIRRGHVPTSDTSEENARAARAAHTHVPTRTHTNTGILGEAVRVGQASEQRNQVLRVSKRRGGTLVAELRGEEDVHQSGYGPVLAGRRATVQRTRSILSVQAIRHCDVRTSQVMAIHTRARL